MIWEQATKLQQNITCTWCWTINSLAPGRPGCNFKTAIFNLVLLIGILTSSKDNALRWMPRDLTDDKSTLVQVMAWCRKATSHYLSQCWPSSMSHMATPGHNEMKCEVSSWFMEVKNDLWNGTQAINCHWSIYTSKTLWLLWAFKEID